jgi:hypothetical protein
MGIVVGGALKGLDVNSPGRRTTKSVKPWVHTMQVTRVALGDHYAGWLPSTPSVRSHIVFDGWMPISLRMTWL